MDAAIEAGSRRQSGVRPIQVMGLFLLLLAAVAGGLFVDFPKKEKVGEVELLAGAVLGPADLAVIEAVFDRSGLDSYRVVDGRLYVDGGQQSSYLRAVVDAGALPPEFGGSLRRAVESDSPWRSKETQAELVRVATQEELSLVIRTMPGIEQAAVLYSGSNSEGLFREAKADEHTASVSIRTETGEELDRHRVQAIRVLVASSIAGLRVEQVALTDLRSGQVFDGPLVSDSEFVTTDPDRARAVAYEHHVTAKIRQALAFIPGVFVEVNASAIELAAGDVKGKEETRGDVRAAANVPAIVGVGLGGVKRKQIAGQVVHVSVAIPETYLQRLREEIYDNVADPAGSEIERLRTLVAGLVPATEPWGRAVVTITRYAGHGAARSDQGDEAFPDQLSGSDAQSVPVPAYSLSTFFPIERNFSIRSAMTGKRIALYGCMALGLSVVLMWWPAWRKQGQRSDSLNDHDRDVIDWATLRRSHQYEGQNEA
jgi:hypothetical protein